MAIHAYNERYFSKARDTLAVAVDYAVNWQGKNIDSFFHKFAYSNIATEFEKGAPSVTVGISGVDLYRMIEKDFTSRLPAYESFNRSPEYWLGWALASFQYSESRSFKEIFKIIKPSEMLMWYNPMHEEDVSSFVSALRKKMMSRKTNLKILRERRGLSQEQLSVISDISLSTIRAYEQRTNDIRNSQYSVLLTLARVLQCSIRELTDESIPFPEKELTDDTKDFSEQLYQEIQLLGNTNNSLQQNALIKSQIIAQQYGYIVQFPYQVMKSVHKNFQIPKIEFIDNWENYWNNQISDTVKTAIDRQELRKSVSETVRELIAKKINKNQKDSYTYDTYCFLNAKSLAYAVYNMSETIVTANLRNE